MPWKERNNMYGKSNPLIKLFEGLTRVDLSSVSFNEGKVPDPSKESPEAQAKKLQEDDPNTQGAQKGAGDGVNTKFEVTKELAEEVGKKLGIDFTKVSVEEFMKGLEIEQEHADVTGGDPEITGQIAAAHLREIPDYYRRLVQMEEEAKKVPAKVEGKPEQEAGKETMPAAESKIKEEEKPTKLTVIASDIADEQEAKKIAADKTGSIVQQDPTTKKYSVVLKESIEDTMAKEYAAECKKYDLDTTDRQNYHEWVEKAYPEYKADMGTEERVMKLVTGIKEVAGRDIADEAAKKYQKTGEFHVPVYEFGIEMFGPDWENKHDPKEVFDELSTKKGEGMARKWLEQEIKAAKAKGVKVDSIKFSETDSGNYTHAGAYYTVVLTVDPKVEGPDGEIAKVMGDGKIVWPKEAAEKVKEAKKADEKGAR